MTRDVKLLLSGVLLIALGMLALAGMDLKPVSPDLGPTFRSHVYHWAGGAALLSVLSGSVMIGGAAIAFCYRLPPKSLSLAGLAFLLAAAVVSFTSRAFVISTYAYVPLLLPWVVSVASGALLLLVAIIRAVLSTRRS